MLWREKGGNIEIAGGLGRPPATLGMDGFVSASPSLHAHEIVLQHRGDRVSGAVIKKDDKSITIKSESFGVITTAWDQIASITADQVVTVVNQAIEDDSGLVFAFGSSFADPGGAAGIHDIHMNQGNPVDNHGQDNGIWQDGALFVYLPSSETVDRRIHCFSNSELANGRSRESIWGLCHACIRSWSHRRGHRLPSFKNGTTRR